jgi:hypothetical protein
VLLIELRGQHAGLVARLHRGTQKAKIHFVDLILGRVGQCGREIGHGNAIDLAESGEVCRMSSGFLKGQGQRGVWGRRRERMRRFYGGRVSGRWKWAYRELRAAGSGSASGGRRSSSLVSNVMPLRPHKDQREGENRAEQSREMERTYEEA